MRRIFLAGLSGALALTCMTAPTLIATGAGAQPLPPGDYRSRCRDIALNGQFLSATCGGVRGGGQSSINVLSCPGSNITVDATGALVCSGIAGGSPGPGAGPGPGYPGGPGGPRPPRPPSPDYGPGPTYGRDVITVYSKKNFSGRSQRFDGVVSNLDNVGLNDHIRSIQLERRSGPWLVCSDANFRGRCQQIDRSIGDTRQIGMDRSISSLRPLR